jgi:uncharacterized protein YkwD
MANFLCLFLLLLCLSCKKDDLAKLNISPEEKEVNQLTLEYMSLVNTHREKIGLPSLQLVDKLSIVAYTHAKNMASGLTSFGHHDFDKRCTEMREIMVRGNLCGEIVAQGQTTAQTLFNSWMSSPGHKSKIEGSRYTHSGFGFEKNSKGTIYWTQVFIEAN